MEMRRLGDIPSSVGIVGSDGYTPLYQPDERFVGDWSIKQIYRGYEGKNMFVPKVGDLVEDTDARVTYIVRSLDPVTFIPELDIYRDHRNQDATGLITLDHFRYIVYYDKTQLPYVLTTESLLHFYRATATHARIYKGTILTPENIISRMYDNSGNYLGHEIPLFDVKMDTHTMTAIKGVLSCKCEIELLQGEDLTVVAYDSEGRVVDIKRAVTYESNITQELSTSNKYIKGIGLRTHFLSKKDDTTLEFPTGLTMNSFIPFGVVYYNDGTTTEYPVDGTKFTIDGLEILKRNESRGPMSASMIATIIGQRIPFVLRYFLSEGEVARTAVGYSRDVIPKGYTMIMSNPDTTYGVKLFTYPYWIGAREGYGLRHYLMNLDRQVFEDVTSTVELVSTSAAFRPTLMGVSQKLEFRLDLGKVSPRYKDFAHVQEMDVLLRYPAVDDRANTLWEIKNEYLTDIPYYGADLRYNVVKNPGKGYDVTLGTKLTEQEFLDQVYYRSSPLVNPVTETIDRIKPTHIQYCYAGEKHLVSLKDYAKTITFVKGVVNLYDNLEIIFLKETGDHLLFMSIANVTMRK